MNKFMEIVGKIFDIFPIQIIISAIIGFIIYALTPSESYLLLKFGKLYYIVFMSAIAFVVIIFIIWLTKIIYKKIQGKKQEKIKLAETEMEYNQRLEEFKNNFFEETDQWDDLDLEILRKLITTNNEVFKCEGSFTNRNGLFTSSLINLKERQVKDGKYLYRVYTYVKLQDSAFEMIKLVYEKYGKLSNFDKGENKDE